MSKPLPTLWPSYAEDSVQTPLGRGLSGDLSVDSKNFKKWGRSPTTTQNVGEGLKIVGDDFMMKFKLIKNTFSVYLDIFNWLSIN